MLRVDIKEDLDAMNTKIEIVQKSYEDLAKTRSDNDSPTSKTSNHANIVIKNLEYDEREDDNQQITVNKVQSLFRDVLVIPDIKVKFVSRKKGKGNSNGLIIVELEDTTQKKHIFSQKKDSWKIVRITREYTYESPRVT